MCLKLAVIYLCTHNFLSFADFNSTSWLKWNFLLSRGIFRCFFSFWRLLLYLPIKKEGKTVCFLVITACFRFDTDPVIAFLFIFFNLLSRLACIWWVLMCYVHIISWSQHVCETSFTLWLICFPFLVTIRPKSLTLRSAWI